MTRPGRYGIVGSGWRTGFFLRMAQAMPDRFAVTGVVTRTAERGQEVEGEWEVPTFRSVGELVAADKPDFVIASVPVDAAPDVTRELVALGIPVLSETPPAPDAAGLRQLWSDVGDSGLVQVAEQNPLLPSHAAQLSLVRAGLLGEVTSVQISSTHLYHAVSVLRLLLDVGLGAATVDNPLRGNRIVIRGSHCELVDDRVVRLADPVSAVESRLVRRQTGIDLNLEGFALDHISHDGTVVYRNPFPGVRLADEDISIAALLARMTAWCHGDGEPPYPLAEACQDHLIGLAIQESAKTGKPVVAGPEPWSP